MFMENMRAGFTHSWGSIGEGVDFVGSLIDDTLEEKLNGMLERLWNMDKIEDDPISTEEQKMIEEHQNALS